MRAEHPEYQKHLGHRQQAKRYRKLLESGREQLEWEQAAERISQLQSLFQAYNNVLWQSFTYCRQCLGGCCVVDATDLKPLDYLALTLLDEALPERPAQPQVSSRACIYLTASGCSWPTAWRPLKCAAFYCLGSGAAELDASDERYLELTAALQEVVAPYLPPDLLEAEREALLESLPDPIAFAQMLAEMAGGPLLDALGLPDLTIGEAEAEGESADPTMELLAFIAEAGAAAVEIETEAAAEMLGDLETLEWVLLGQPAQSQALLAEMLSRYSGPAPELELSTLWTGLRQQVQQLLQTM